MIKCTCEPNTTELCGFCKEELRLQHLQEDADDKQANYELEDEY